MRNPFFIAMGAGLGSVAIMGGATVIASSVVLTVVKQVTKKQRVSAYYSINSATVCIQ